MKTRYGHLACRLQSPCFRHHFPCRPSSWQVRMESSCLFFLDCCPSHCSGHSCTALGSGHLWATTGLYWSASYSSSCPCSGYAWNDHHPGCGFASWPCPGCGSCETSLHSFSETAPARPDFCSDDAPGCCSFSGRDLSPLLCPDSSAGLDFCFASCRGS